MTPKEVILELFGRLAAGDETVIDELIAEDMVNHPAGPSQGREGWKRILARITNDLGPVTVENHTFITEGDMVVQHMTMQGMHVASTMPLLTGVPVAHKPVAWTFIHIWRVVDGSVVEHWACRDDVGLLQQVGAWPHSAAGSG